MNPLFYLYAGLNQIFFSIRSALAWEGRRYQEKPAGTLRHLSDGQRAIIGHLNKKYPARFEAFLNKQNALRNYHLLHLLDQVSERFHWRPKEGARLLDVGSKNFYYAPALHAFFMPRQFVGIELDGFHMYRGFYTNLSYANYYEKQISNTAYRVMNFKDYHAAVDGMIWLFPFVLKEDVVTWYLPLHAFEPMALFQHARNILAPEGFIFMMNTDVEEFSLSADFLRRIGFSQQGLEVYENGLLPKKITPYISLWVHSAGQGAPAL
jgi:hypothetical protein